MPVTHIYWFAYFNTDEPSVRYRGSYALEHMRSIHSISYDIAYPGYQITNICRFLKIYLTVLVNRKPGSVIVYEKIHTNRFYARALKLLLALRPEMTIYDIDDADYLKFPPKNIYHFMKHCSICSTGSMELMKKASEMNKNVLLLTSPVIDHLHFKAARNSQFTIGWIGYYNAHRKSLLELFFPSLKKLNFPVKLILLGVTKPDHLSEVRNYFNDSNHVTLEMPENINWHNEQEIYKKIASFDIGVAPLLPTAINKAKSAFKIKQYLSCGIPVLGSEFGENSMFLKNNSNGYICNDSNDYVKYIKHIAEMNDNDYAFLSRNALLTKGSFSMDNYCETLLQYLNFPKNCQATFIN